MDFWSGLGLAHWPEEEDAGTAYLGGDVVFWSEAFIFLVVVCHVRLKSGKSRMALEGGRGDLRARHPSTSITGSIYAVLLLGSQS